MRNLAKKLVYVMIIIAAIMLLSCEDEGCTDCRSVQTTDLMTGEMKFMQICEEVDCRDL